MAPVFRFLPAEVAEMETHMRQLKETIFPRRFVIDALAEKFSASLDRAGKVPVQPKQVLNWFHNRRYSHRNKAARSAPAPGKMMPGGSDIHPAGSFRVPPSSSSFLKSEKNSMEASQIQFEATSAKDGAWYDVDILSYRLFESGDPEVQVRFSAFGAAEDEWVNLRRCVRQRSLQCRATDCTDVVPGDTVLCFKEGEERALYFDARVVDAQRQRHDLRGCRCRFLVQYEHDQSEEIVPLRMMCHRPETHYKLQILPASRASADLTPNQKSTAEQKTPKQHKMTAVTNEVTMVSDPDQEKRAGKTAAPLPSGAPETSNNSGSDVEMKAAVAAPMAIEIDD
ncbi:protein SAWADEE HOMEODOMAIN HOMOLOG 2-like [Phragmites australis]|uniref:protein SAWADEE HOMEODOMAIN HOMOLOG 2-like n=1 Tax=Phragmites australis TaxID=29695 RepID=UPI002D7A10F6|nr:protein SAWADEE HOMEODOMAIN HOMOLOG 2-like [Phragmites australis]